MGRVLKLKKPRQQFRKLKKSEEERKKTIVKRHLRMKMLTRKIKPMRKCVLMCTISKNQWESK